MLSSTWSRSPAQAQSNPQPADADARGFPEHAFASQDRTAVIPGGTGGTGGTAANSANFWWYRTVGPVGPPWKIADPRGQPWAHWSHLSVPPVRANSCGVPPVPPSPPKKLSREMKMELRIMTAQLGGTCKGTGLPSKAARSHPAAAIPTVREAAFRLAGRGPVRSDRASWGLHSGDVTGIGGSGAPRRRFADPAWRCGAL